MNSTFDDAMQRPHLSSRYPVLVPGPQWQRPFPLNCTFIAVLLVKDHTRNGYVHRPVHLLQHYSRYLVSLLVSGPHKEWLYFLTCTFIAASFKVPSFTSSISTTLGITMLLGLYVCLLQHHCLINVSCWPYRVDKHTNNTNDYLINFTSAHALFYTISMVGSTFCDSTRSIKCVN